MTPEEHFARLRDPGNWTVRASVPARRSRRTVAVLVPVAVAAVLVLVFLAVVQGVRGAHPQPLTTDTSTSTPTSTPSPTPAPSVPSLPVSARQSPPEIVFGGECGQLLPDALVVQLTGRTDLVTTGVPDFDLTKPEQSVIPQNGGLRCSWAPSRSTDHPVMEMVALPSVGSRGGDSGVCVRGDTCTFDISLSQLEVRGYIDEPAKSVDSGSLRSLVTTRLNTLASIPPRYEHADGDWASDLDCTAVATATGDEWVDVADAPVANRISPAGETVQQFQSDADSGFAACQLVGAEDGTIDITVLAGAGWLSDTISSTVHGATTATIPGADLALVDEASAGIRSLIAVDGANLLVMRSGDQFLGGLEEDLSARVLAALDKSAGVTHGTPRAAGPPVTDLALNSEGLGPIKVGQSVPADQDITYWLDNFCGFTGSGSKPGGWQNDYRTPDGHYSFWVEADYGAQGATKTSPVNKIYVFDPAIRTKHGLHVGSSLAEVKALGAVSEKTSDGAYYDVGWVIHGYSGQLVAWVDKNDKVTSLEVDKEGTTPSAAGEITPCD